MAPIRRNQHVKLEYVQIEKLRGWKDNPRIMPKDQMQALIGSIDHFGIVDPIIVNQSNLVIGGHQRIDAGKSLGLKTVPVIRVKVTDREMKTLNLALNRISGEWDETKLAPLLAELKKFPEINLTGFTQAEIDEITAPLSLGNEEEDVIPEPPVEPILKLGDIWQLDKHRVMCGDAKIHLPILLGTVKPDLLLTDPPYGIEIVQYGKVGIAGRPGLGSTNQAEGIVKARIYPVMTNDIPDFDPTFVLGICPTEIVFGANHFADRLPRGSHWLVWDKKAEIGADHNFFSDAELAWTNVQKKTCRVYRHLWSGLIRAGTRDLELKERVHPTQKPVGLFSAIIADYSEPNHVILDPFLGSGTTLIACEQLGRTCLGLEIEPLYVDIIVKRWETLTNKKAIRVGT